MKRLTRVLALCLCGLLALAGCNGPAPQPTASAEPSPSPAPAPSPTVPPDPAQLRLGWDPTASLHPITGDSQVNQELTGLVYQGLYELDNTFTPQPVLARSASVGEDGLTWTITLAAGTVFSDGTPLTAQHVAASLEAARASPLYAARLAEAASVTAGEDAVYITLSVPNGNLPALLDIPIVLEQGQTAQSPEEGGEQLPAPPLGTGCYQYQQTGDGMSLQANPYYKDASSLPYAAIPLTAVSEAAERIAAFDSGDITAVTTDFTSPYALGYSSCYEAADYPTTSLLYVGFRASGVCGSAEVRQAFSRAFDRDALVSVELSGHGDPSALPVSPLSGEYSKAAAARLEYDPDGAGQLLSQAGYTRNEDDGLFYNGAAPLAVTLAVNSDNDVRQAVAAELAGGLEALGVTVTVNHLPWEDFTAALAAGQFDLYIGEVRLPGDFDPSALLTGALNYGGFYHEGLSGALARWKAARGDQRAQAAHALWEQFAQTAPFAPLCFKQGSLLMRWGMASDLQPTRGNPYANIQQWTTTGSDITTRRESE